MADEIPHRSYLRKMSTDSGAPSMLEDNTREETELKQPVRSHITPNSTDLRKNMTYKNFTKQYHGQSHGHSRSGHTSDTSTITSHIAPTTDTEGELNVLRYVEKIVPKRPSKKGKHSENPYHVHIGKIVINNHPKPSEYDHPPPPPCASSYNYINDKRERNNSFNEEGNDAEYSNLGREAMEQGSTPGASSPGIEEEELHAMINPYKETTANFLASDSDAHAKMVQVSPTVKTSEGNYRDNPGYGFLSKPELNIEALTVNGEELEITLQSKGSRPVVFKGTLKPQGPVEKSCLLQPSAETASDRLTHSETQTTDSISFPVDGQPNDSGDYINLNQNPGENKGKTIPAHLSKSAPELFVASTKYVQCAESSGAPEQNHRSEFALNMPTHGQYSPSLTKTGENLWMSEQHIAASKNKTFWGIVQKSKEKHVCFHHGIDDAVDERYIISLKEDLCIKGREHTWIITQHVSCPSHPYTLNVKKDNSVVSYPICKDKKKRFSIENKSKKTFSCLCKLIWYYKNNTLPNERFNLGAEPFLRRHIPSEQGSSFSPQIHETTDYGDTRL